MTKRCWLDIAIVVAVMSFIWALGSGLKTIHAEVPQILNIAGSR